jgi:hypothetical protein
MVLSTAVRPVNGSAQATKPLAAFAIRFRQKRPDVNLYVTALPVRELLGRFTSDTYRADNPSGYQRSVLLAGTPGVKLPTGGGRDTTHIHCPLHPPPHRAQFEPAAEETSGGESGLLTISPDVALWVVDGQHRLAGLERALKGPGQVGGESRCLS